MEMEKEEKERENLIKEIKELLRTNQRKIRIIINDILGGLEEAEKKLEDDSVVSALERVHAYVDSASTPEGLILAWQELFDDKSRKN